MGKKLLLISLFVTIVLFCFYFYLERNIKITEAAQITEPAKETKTFNLTLIATGDNLFHLSIVNRNRRGNTHNFDSIYTEIKSLITNADLAFINQETVMAGEKFGYSGFPLFNTPQVLAKTLSETGFNIINLANNHAMDMGAEGLYATLDLLNSMEEFTVIGARRSGESHRTITQNNITLGFLAYTYSLNGIRLPAGNPNLVSVINIERMTKEIKTLRLLCDFLIVSMHWGDEYIFEPSPEQKSFAAFLAEQNVDLIIGHHPHILQPAETLQRPDGGATLCFYSLGNFVSNQIGKERMLGAVMLATFTKENTGLLPGELYISNSGLIPIICHFEDNFTNTKVYPLYRYTEELLEKHMMRKSDEEMDFGYFNSVIYNLGTKIIMYNPFLD